LFDVLFSLHPEIARLQQATKCLQYHVEHVATYGAIRVKLACAADVRAHGEGAKGAPTICCAVLLCVKLTQEANRHLQLRASKLLNGTRDTILQRKQFERCSLPVRKGAG
jgi:hypothetical protein